MATRLPNGGAAGRVDVGVGLARTDLKRTSSRRSAVRWGGNVAYIWSAMAFSIWPRGATREAWYSGADARGAGRPAMGASACLSMTQSRPLRKGGGGGANRASVLRRRHMNDR